jgi:hypothetical protein
VSADQGEVTQNRREAPRLAPRQPARLEFAGRAVACTVLDISATGVRVRLTGHALVPDQVVFRTVLADHEVVLPCWLRRAEPGPVVALAFDDRARPALSGAIAAAQRAALADQVRERIDLFTEPAPGA